jgi:hypothetical protein
VLVAEDEAATLQEDRAILFLTFFIEDKAPSIPRTIYTRPSAWKLVFSEVRSKSRATLGSPTYAIHPTAGNKSSLKFAARNIYLAYKNSPFGGCA